MVNLSDQEFEQIVHKSIENIPEPYASRIENVAFMIEDEPTMEQRRQLNLHCNQTLFGLYEGTPLTNRFGSVKILPDKITIFRYPILASSRDLNEVIKKVNNTVWHEVAHYFGLDHDRIHALENKGGK